MVNFSQIIRSMFSASPYAAHLHKQLVDLLVGNPLFRSIVHRTQDGVGRIVDEAAKASHDPINGVKRGVLNEARRVREELRQGGASDPRTNQGVSETSLFVLFIYLDLTLHTYSLMHIDSGNSFV